MSAITEMKEKLENSYYCNWCEEWFDTRDENELDIHSSHMDLQLMKYYEMIRVLENVLGYENSLVDSDDVTIPNLALLCQHASVRIRRLQEEADED